MQGLLSYSDDEDVDQQPLASTSSSTSSFLSVPIPTNASSTKRELDLSFPPPHPSPWITQLPCSELIRTSPLSSVDRPSPPPPSHRPPPQAGPPRASSKPLLPPNIVRKAPFSATSNTSSSSAYPPSPLRQPHTFSPSRGDSPPPPAPFPRDDSSGLSEEDQLKALLKPPRLKNGDGWEEEYGLKRMGDAAAMREVDESLQTKTTFFLSLKQKGTHFNDSLMQNKAFRNPTIYKKLVDHVGVDERAGRYGSVWEWGKETDDGEWGVERISDLQKSRSSSSSNAPPPPGSRSSIAFSSSSSSSSSHHPPFGFAPNPLLSNSHSRADKQASLRDALASRSSSSAPAGSARGVVSGGKEYGFVGLPGGLAEEVPSSSSGKGKRDRDRDGKHGGGKEGKVSRWG